LAAGQQFFSQNSKFFIQNHLLPPLDERLPVDGDALWREPVPECEFIFVGREPAEGVAWLPIRRFVAGEELLPVERRVELPKLWGREVRVLRVELPKLCGCVVPARRPAEVPLPAPTRTCWPDFASRLWLAPAVERVLLRRVPNVDEPVPCLLPSLPAPGAVPPLRPASP